MHDVRGRDASPTGTVRFGFSPDYQRTNAGEANYLGTGSTVWLFQHGALLPGSSSYLQGTIGIYHSGGNGYIRLQYRREDDASIPAAISLFPLAAVRGAWYEIELAWDFSVAPGHVYAFLDGTLMYQVDTITWNGRSSVSALGLCFGPTPANTYGSSFRNVQCFATVQHTATYVPAAMARAEMRDGAATFTGPVVVGAPTRASHAATRAFAESVAAVTRTTATLIGGAASIVAHLAIANVSGLITCHFTTLSGAGVAPGAVASITGAAGIPAGLRPAAGYVTVAHEFRVGVAWYTMTVGLDGTLTLARDPAWSLGDDMNFTDTMTWSNV